MKNQSTKSPLQSVPSFVKVLDEKELLAVFGGLLSATTGTQSMCHKDGTNEGGN